MVQVYTDTTTFTNPDAANAALPPDLAQGDRAYLTALQDQLASESAELRKALGQYAAMRERPPADHATVWANDFLLLITERDDNPDAATIHVRCPNCAGDLVATFPADPDTAPTMHCESACGESGWVDAHQQRGKATQMYPTLGRILNRLPDRDLTSDELRPILHDLLRDLLRDAAGQSPNAPLDHSERGPQPLRATIAPAVAVVLAERNEQRAADPNPLPIIPAKTTTGVKQAEKQRYTEADPCPICDGYDSRADGVNRCYGFWYGVDGTVAFCTDEDYAGELTETHKDTDAYMHVLAGNCRCGTRHDGEAWAEPKGPAKGTIVATYPYMNQFGQLGYQVVRFDPKDFRQRRPKVDQPRDDHGEDWDWSLKGVTRTLYRLPELIAAPHTETVFIVEGEKDCDRLRSLGLTATTNAQGAKKWQDDFGPWLIGRNVAIIADNDEKGREHVAKVARNVAAFAASVKVIELPDMPEKGDVSDYLDTGKNADDLLNIVADTPVWEPTSGITKRIISIAEMRQRRGAPWLIQKNLPQQSLALLAADYATFKSIQALAWGMSVATGHDWAGRKVAQGNVLYIVAEGGGGIAKRLRAWEQHHGIKAENIWFITAPVQFLDTGDVDALAAEIAALAAEVGTFALIIVDTVARSMVGGNENDTGDMGLFVASCDRLKDTFGCTVVAVHHFNKSGTTRGSVALPAACDTIFLMERKGDTVTMTCEKMKDAAEPEPVTFTRTIVEFDTADDDHYAPASDDEDDDDRTSIVLEVEADGATGELTPLPMTRAETEYQLAYSLLACKAGGMTNKEWEDVCVHRTVNAAAARKGKQSKGNMGRNAFFAVKKSLIENGDVVEEGTGRTKVYKVTDPARGVA